MIFGRDDKRRPVAYRADIPKGGVRIGPWESVTLPLQAVTRSGGTWPVMRRTLWCVVVIALLATGFFFINSAKSTCGIVGCPGWCQSGGISCGMPIPPGGWQHGQTAWR